MSEERLGTDLIGGVTPETPTRGVPTETAGTAPQESSEPELVPRSELERLRQERERDVARVKSALQRRQAELERENLELRKAIAERENYARQLREQSIAATAQALPEEQRDQYLEYARQEEAKAALMEAARRIDEDRKALAEREAALKTVTAMAQARQYRENKIQEYVGMGVPKEIVTSQEALRSPEAMNRAAIEWLSKNRGSSPIPSRITSSVAGTPTADWLTEFLNAPPGEREKIGDRLVRQARQAPRR